MNLNKWAIKWGVPYDAVDDLRREFGLADTTPVNCVAEGLSEAAIQNLVRLEASHKGMRVFRNNVGATYTEDGSFLRYGLANDSKQMNDHVKSSDLIGIRPVVITAVMVGSVIGQFVAREVKAGNWKYTGSKREVAQLRFLEIVVSLGGDGAFANDEGTL